MKLTKSDYKNLSNILATTAVGGIEDIIIEDGLVRGVNEDRSFVILSRNNVPQIDKPLGLKRLNILRSRLELFNDLEAEIETKDNDRGISGLEISAGKTKSKFQCSSAALIKAPKSMNDADKMILIFKEDELKLVLNAIRVMGGKTSSLSLQISNENTVTVKIVTEDMNDNFSTVLENSAELLEGESESKTFFYSPSIFTSALSASKIENKIAAITLGRGGTINLIINDHTCVILPKLGSDE